MTEFLYLILSESFELKELRRQLHQTHEENNLLRLKVEILLDMLAQKTAEANIRETDLEKMRNILQKQGI